MSTVSRLKTKFRPIVLATASTADIATAIEDCERLAAEITVRIEGLNARRAQLLLDDDDGALDALELELSQAHRDAERAAARVDALRDRLVEAEEAAAEAERTRRISALREVVKRRIAVCAQFDAALAKLAEAAVALDATQTELLPFADIVRAPLDGAILRHKIRLAVSYAGPVVLGLLGLGRSESTPEPLSSTEARTWGVFLPPQKE